MPSRRRDSKAPRRSSPPKVIPSRDKTRHLILDGYNCIHAHPKLKAQLAAHGTDAVRDALGELVRILHDYEGWQLTIVFDGTGSKIDIERPDKKDPNFSYLYSPSGISADEVIEGLAAKTAPRDDVLVCTADGAIRVSAQVSGARWIAPDELWRLVDQAQDSLTRALKRLRPSKY
jgi:predicted RNA-binding protein with PIN domain